MSQGRTFKAERTAVQRPLGGSTLHTLGQQQGDPGACVPLSDTEGRVMWDRVGHPKVFCFYSE